MGADDKKKALERTVSQEENEIATAKESIATLTSEMAALEAGIKALDKSVAEATEQRKEEHAEYKDLVTSNNAALELLGWAKNRLNKFYNPKLYKPPAKVELSREGRIHENLSGTQAPTAAPVASRVPASPRWCRFPLKNGKEMPLPLRRRLGTPTQRSLRRIPESLR